MNVALCSDPVIHATTTKKKHYLIIFHAPLKIKNE
jgi:hypothetical protein